MASLNSYSDNKVNEFMHAIQKYLSHWRYKSFERLVSFLVISLQAMTLFNLIDTYESTSCFYLILVLIVAYIATDFINGLVHMYMDNNTYYNSAAGPYIAAFHLHHAKFFYTVRHPLRVYFDESGTKFWLLTYLLVLVGVQFSVHLSVFLNTGLVAFGIFSSIAELSHYWCHNATKKNRLILWLQNHHILLSKEHHKAHHCSDNTHYAFLNGVTDPLINLIARCYYQGYKNHADQHTRAYMQQTYDNSV
ncbi:fatty acid desaturase CarF family protein [Legionella lytica]|uniref:Fatty acid desaturase CarF family protein n=1 Tax=Legionella lytica TaxID=96232 RepID=A0ABW8DD83_9GAMM